jgi:hypothetical protein
MQSGVESPSDQRWAPCIPLQIRALKSADGLI